MATWNPGDTTRIGSGCDVRQRINFGAAADRQRVPPGQEERHVAAEFGADAR